MFKILRVTFDNRMTLQKHITNICRSVNIHSRKINSIRRYLSNTAGRTLVQSSIIARLDYCNSVCIGLPMNRLQLLQNSAARVISQTKRYTSITPILNELHWLQINKLCPVQNTAFNFQIVEWVVSRNTFVTCSTFTCLIDLYDLLHLHHLCHIEIDPYD